MVHEMSNSYALELEAIDISAHAKGNVGIPYYTTFDSGKPGPHVAINAVTHGNELCGPLAIDFLYRHNVQPLIGKLTLGFANYEAYLSYTPDDPHTSRFLDEDLNRVWSLDVLDGDRSTIETRRAREIRPLIDQIDYLFDIHTMQHDTPALVLSGPHAKGREFAKAVGIPEHVISDEGHASGKRLRDYGGFGDPASPKNALLIECGQHWEKSSQEMAIHSTLRVLLHHGQITRDFAEEHLPAEAPKSQTFYEVTEPITIKTSDFRFIQDFKGMEVIGEKGTIIAYDGDEEVTTPHDNCMLLMPNRRLWTGQTAVRLCRILD